MKKRIFIGSSTEAIHYAEQIKDILGAQGEIIPLIWTDVFDPGTLTFEAIERMAKTISGAVLLATPDDESIIRRTTVRVPRSNVLIEFGYLAAILGRTNIALCRYNGVELATDLNAFTCIPMGDYQGVAGAQVVDAQAAKKLIKWSQKLTAVSPGVPNYAIVHGYSGRWSVKLKFDIWRNMQIESPAYVHLEGVIDLFLPRKGKNGHGSVIGDLYVNLKDHYIHINMSALVENVLADDDGTLSATSRVHSRQLLSKEGESEEDETVLDSFRGPRDGKWFLYPNEAVDGQLNGTFTVSAGDLVSDRANALLTKL
ncbi:nucleotide-binding protein [Halomonas sp. BM-2019]|uniref:nucleotide-binding protein n=1 Tax=Halomonas sp. BM-2019 TaxID=2811227 RepID=UPI001B3C2049|nr:MAG: nucleotide-binding protein [Halomonas sp. BM-2019]